MGHQKIKSFLFVLLFIAGITQPTNAKAILQVTETTGDYYTIIAQDETNSSVQYFQCKVDIQSGGVYEFRDLTDAGDGLGGHTDYCNDGAYNRKCPLLYFDGRSGNVCTRSSALSGLADRLSFNTAADGSSFTITYTEDANSAAYLHSSYGSGDFALTSGDLWTTITMVIRPPDNNGTFWDWSIMGYNVSNHGLDPRIWSGQGVRVNFHEDIAKTLDSEISLVSGIWDSSSPESYMRFTIGENIDEGFTQGREFIMDYRYDMEDYSSGGTLSTGTWASFDYVTYWAPYNATTNYALEPGDTRGDYGQLMINIAESTIGSAPTADAGSDQDFIIHTYDPQSVTLNASGSSDSDGTITSYTWTDITGATLATGINPTISLEEGVYFIILTIEDNDGNIARDEMVVTIEYEWDYTLYDAWPGRNETDPNQLVNLYNSGVNCPAITDLTWPANAGDAELCLYEDDKFAATSLTVDDNTVPNHQFWINQSSLYGFDVTWFIIVGSHRLNSGNAYFGTWETFENLYNLGFDVQSHTISHNSDDASRTDDEVHWEYSYSRALIEDHTDLFHCLTLGYPYGSGKQDIAAQYYIACRGTTGGYNMPQNTATNILNTRTGSFTSIPNIVSGGSNPRAWLNCLWHLISDETAQAATFATYSSYYDDIWFGSYADVAKYLQEFYTATLTVTSANETTGVTMTLSDRMFDDVFDYPLTVKVKIWNSWADCNATQNGQSVDAEIITYNNEQYALVKAVPDQGTVVITPTGQSNIDPVADAGSDQSVTDSDDNGYESVTLAGTGSSDSDGTITSYVWTENSTQIATGSQPTLSLATGTHTITLTVTDDDSATDTDTVVVTINEYTNVAPVADAGSNQNVTDSDDDGYESVTLDGSGSSDSDGTIISYVWTENSTQIATGSQPTISLAVGTHNITLTVTDDDGATDTDTVEVVVSEYIGAVLTVAETTGDYYTITAHDYGDANSIYWEVKVDITSGGIFSFKDYTDAGDGSGGHMDYCGNGAYNRQATLFYFDGRGGRVFTRKLALTGLADRLSFTTAPDGSSFTISYTEDALSSAYFHSSYADGSYSLTPGDLYSTIQLVITPPDENGTAWDWSIDCENVSGHSLSGKIWAGEFTYLYILDDIVASYDYEDSLTDGAWYAADPESFMAWIIGSNSSLGLTNGRQFTSDVTYGLADQTAGGTVSTGSWAGYNYVRYVSGYNYDTNLLADQAIRTIEGKLMIDIPLE